MTLYSIQYLRAVAALMVSANHVLNYPLNVETGEQGVDIFFIISGFIMLYIMDKNEKSWSEFLNSRFLRIAPLYYLCTIFAIIIGFIEIPDLLHSIQAITFIKFYKTSPPLNVGWTLEYEFIFYALCSFSILIFARKKKQIIFILFMLLCAVILIDFIIFSEKKYGHFAEFGLGALIFLIYRFKFFKKVNKNIFIIFALVGFFLLIYTDIVIYKDNFTYLRFVYWGIPSFLIVLSILLLEDKIFHSKLLLYLGNASYSIYLIHLPALYILENTFNYDKLNSSFYWQIFNFILIIIFACLVHTYIEKNISNFLKLKLRKKN
jgi:exopolysaccharide production protein ExoZ